MGWEKKRKKKKKKKPDCCALQRIKFITDGTFCLRWPCRLLGRGDLPRPLPDTGAAVTVAEKYLLTGVEHDTKCEGVSHRPSVLPPRVPLTGSLQWISLLCVCFAVMLRCGGRRAFTPGATSAHVSESVGECDWQWPYGKNAVHLFVLFSPPTHMCEGTCDAYFQATAS